MPTFFQLRNITLPAALAWLLFLLPAIGSPQSASTGIVSGIVLDASVETPLPGATVSIQGTSFSAAAGRDGRFQLVGVPAGEQKLSVGYLGHEPATTTITVTAGQVLPLEVTLRETVTLREEVTVSATPIQEGQARALNQQRTAPNIVNVISSDQIGQFPDSNAAEATQRIPGVTIERDQGEGRYVAIRGTEPRLNSMMINGERIPSPEGDIRAVALDVVPDRFARLDRGDQGADSRHGRRRDWRRRQPHHARRALAADSVRHPRRRLQQPDARLGTGHVQRNGGPPVRGRQARA